MGMVGSQGLLSLSSGKAYLGDTLAHGGDYLTLLDGLTTPYTERIQRRWSQGHKCSAGCDTQAVSESQMASLPGQLRDKTECKAGALISGLHGPESPLTGYWRPNSEAGSGSETLILHSHGQDP